MILLKLSGDSENQGSEIKQQSFIVLRRTHCGSYITVATENILKGKKTKLMFKVMCINKM